MAESARNLPQLLTIAEAAKMLGFSTKHVRRELVNTGLLQVVSLGKGAKGDRFELQEVERLIKSRKGICRSTKETVSTTTASSSTNARLGALLGPLPKERLKKSSGKPDGKPQRTFKPDEAESLSHIPLVMPS